MKTKILIVDDSRIFRSAIEESLAPEKDIKVIGSVWNGIKAIEFIHSHRPDIITLDVEMPDMDGLETLKAIRKINAADKNARPVGVIMVSSFTQKGADTTIRALEAGAFDFITKPEGRSAAENIKLLGRQLVLKIRYFVSRHISEGVKEKNTGAEKHYPTASSRRPVHRRTVSGNADLPRGVRAILIGVSTGGPRALASMLPRLCEKVSLPIFIVQHMPPTFTQSLAGSLDTRCQTYTVTEGGNNVIVRDRHIYIAPGGRHMLIRKRGGDIFIVINKQPPEKGCRPSADILFRSATTAYGGNVIGLILTGMGSDGTKGAGSLKRAGAYIIAQDEESSVVWGMPGSVKASGSADEILPLMRIPDAVSAVIRRTPGE